MEEDAKSQVEEDGNLKLLNILTALLVVFITIGNVYKSPNSIERAVQYLHYKFKHIIFLHTLTVLNIIQICKIFNFYRIENTFFFKFK